MIAPKLFYSLLHCRYRWGDSCSSRQRSLAPIISLIHVRYNWQIAENNVKLRPFFYNPLNICFLVFPSLFFSSSFNQCCVRFLNCSPSCADFVVSSWSIISSIVCQFPFCILLLITRIFMIQIQPALFCGSRRRPTCWSLCRGKPVSHLKKTLCS